MEKERFDAIKHHFSFEKRISHYEDYFQAAVIVLLIESEGEYHLLFEKRTETIKQGGEICFPGGKIEPTDESSLEAALRETQEELGCDPKQIEVLGRSEILLLASGVTVEPYIGILHQSIDTLHLSEKEVEAIFTLPLTHFLENQPDHYDCKVLVHPYVIDPLTNQRQELLPVKELELPSRYNEPWGAGRQRIYAYPTDHGLIWGLTAQIINDCVTTIQALIT